jgi:transcriptional regulator with XRE-family HTH domain/ribosomal protein S27E
MAKSENEAIKDDEAISVSGVSERSTETKRETRVPSLAEILELQDQGLSLEEIGKKLGTSKSKVWRLLHGTKTGSSERVEPLREDVSTGADRSMDSMPLNEPTIFLEDAELRSEKQRLKAEIDVKRLRARSRYLDFIAEHPEAYVYHQQRNGHDASRENETIKDLKQEVRDLKQSLQNNPLGYMKLGVDAFKAGADTVSKGQGVNPMEYVTAGINLRADVEKNVQSQFSVGVQKGEADIKIEDMRQHERIDMRRLDMAEKELDHKLASEGKTIEQVKDLVKTVTEGPIGKAIENIGGATSDRIRGGRSLIKVQCPNCQNTFGVNPTLPVVKCVHCGAELKAASQPQQETQPQQTEQTETKAQETEEIHRPQQEAQPTEPHETEPIDKSLIGSREDPWA